MTKAIPSEFQALRARAKARRDKLINEARVEYDENLREIAKLELNLVHKAPAKFQRIASCIDSVIPRQDTFTAQEILIALETLDPGRYWRRRSVDSHLSTLRERGVIKRLSRSNINEPARYVRYDVDVETSPVASMSLIAVIRSVLKRPMTTMDVVFAVKDAGYRTSMTDKRFCRHVAKELARTFKETGGKWSVG